MFKKSNRNFKAKRVDLSDEEDKESSSETAIHSATTAEFKPVDKQPVVIKPKITCLDEPDEEDSQSEFKVKKSKESRRIAREFKKSKKPDKPAQQHAQQLDTSVEEIKNDEIEGVRFKPLVAKKPESVSISKYLKSKYGHIINDDEEEDEFKQFREEEKEKRKSSSSSHSEDMNQQDNEDDKLENLRQQMDILAGEEADTFDGETDETKRSVKIMLKSGIIPDSHYIHEARKRREMARQEGDYIPVSRPAAQPNRRETKSRLVREDENDLSDEENAHKSIINMNFKENMIRERQQARENFLAYEEGSDEDQKSEKTDDEEDEWEKEQISRGVLLSQAPPSKRVDFRMMKESRIIDKLADSDEDSQLDSVRLKLENLNSLNQITFSSIRESIEKSVDASNERLRSLNNEAHMITQNLNANKSDLANINTMRPNLNQQYVFYQELREFLIDYIDCYNEKIVVLEKTEEKWLGLFKKIAERVVNRRQTDMNDQNSECALLLSKVKKPLEAAHEARKSERAARRENKRANRNPLFSNGEKKQDLELNEGFSTDEEEIDPVEIRQQRDEIKSELNQQILADINDDFYDVKSIKQKFEKWRSLSSSTYTSSYVAHSLSKLFSPLVRLELIDWNPLEAHSDVDILEKTKWYTELLSYNKESIKSFVSGSNGQKLDDDLFVIPQLIEKIVLVRLISLAEHVYDPLSTTQTYKFTQLINKFTDLYPTFNQNSTNTNKLIEAVVNRIKKCIDNEVFVPIYPKEILEQKESEFAIFFNCQFNQCLKCFANVLKWKQIISEHKLKELAVDYLLNRFLMISLQACLEANMNTFVIIDYIVKQMPQEWFIRLTSPEPSLNKSMLSQTQLDSLCKLIRRIADSLSPNQPDFKESMKKIHKLLVYMGAAEHALSLASAFDFF